VTSDEAQMAKDRPIRTLDQVKRVRPSVSSERNFCAIRFIRASSFVIMFSFGSVAAGVEPVLNLVPKAQSQWQQPSSDKSSQTLRAWIMC
jgi:hypothetical protein